MDKKMPNQEKQPKHLDNKKGKKQKMVKTNTRFKIWVLVLVFMASGVSYISANAAEPSNPEQKKLQEEFKSNCENVLLKIKSLEITKENALENTDKVKDLVYFARELFKRAYAVDSGIPYEEINKNEWEYVSSEIFLDLGKFDTYKFNKKYFADLKTNKKECCKEFVKENGVLHELRKITRDWYKKVDWKKPDLQAIRKRTYDQKDQGIWVEISQKLEGTPHKMVRIDLDAYKKRIQSMRPEDTETKMNYYKIRRLVDNDDFLYDLVQLIENLIPSTVSKTIKECDKEYDDFSVKKYRYKYK